jgi:hypothetical protein
MTKKRAIALLLTLCLLLSLCACTQTAQNGGAESTSAAAAQRAPEPEPEPVTFLIQYPGFVDQYFDAENRVLVLENSEDNQVDFLFELTDRKGAVLFRSEAVKPGEETGWDVTEHWQQHDHQLTITSTPVYEDGSQGNPVSQTIIVTVELGE